MMNLYQLIVMQIHILKQDSSCSKNCLELTSILPSSPTYVLPIYSTLGSFWSLHPKTGPLFRTYVERAKYFLYIAPWTIVHFRKWLYDLKNSRFTQHWLMAHIKALLLFRTQVRSEACGRTFNLFPYGCFPSHLSSPP